ncbi:hypothetical protein M422DRAFT_254184 [Sphaerobolus stellatus SS14]|uniref:Unplaced genomic scaffold SPHSTscaffold_53, whole genome shotgun sequence n=1 Tax=Sphaerobolus stellatus (strain SS14) TaxID=990650 RepID=A0A0C9V6X2_SPHS4|nr:hypothetical protein M422DRAFT_254184 [Sphaerobolus stellatus SS14]
MSDAASSSKTTNTNTILYKKSKDVPHLPLVEKSDLRRMLSGFKIGIEDWEGYGKEERKTLLGRYWRAFDKEYAELEALYVSLVRQEAKAEAKQKSEEEKKKKKNKTVVPVASGSRKDKGKARDVEEVVDSGSDTDMDTEFRRFAFCWMATI